MNLILLAALALDAGLRPEGPPPLSRPVPLCGTAPCLGLAFQDDGWSKLQAGGETVEVYRDAYGVPHIFAPGAASAFWAEGYTEAQDRWRQMEKFRRAARGEGAELIGRESFASDVDVRRHGYTEEERRKMLEAASPRTREILTAYAAGVNAWLKERGVEARPWGETDCVAIGVAMARRFGEAGDVELQIQEVYSFLEKKLGVEKARQILRDILRDSDPTAPTTLNDHERGGGKEGGFLRPPALRSPACPPKLEERRRKGEGGGTPMEGYADHRRFLDDARRGRDALGWPAYFGSNAWVVAPSKSKSGRAMLYGGPMMGFRAPSICNEIHIEAGDLKVGGMSFPGVPGVMIGFNDRLAWTTTSGGADLVDVYALTLNEKGEYQYKGEWRAFEAIEQEIAIRDEEPVKTRILRSVHGPITGKIDEKNRRAYSLRYSFWMQEHLTIEAVLDMNFAKDVKEFEAAARKIVTSHNFFVADREGNIGFWYCGAHPKRKKEHDPRFPQPGDGSMDWEGILSPDEWPQAVNPKHGFFANWNNKPARSWEPSGFGTIFWGKRIIDDIESRGKLGFDEFQAIARRTAYHSFLFDYFGPFLLEAARGSTAPDAKKAVEALSKWDGQEAEGDPRPVLVERWCQEMMRRVFGPYFDATILANREVQKYLMDPLLYLLLGDKSAVKLNFDWAQGRDLKKLAREAFDETIRAGWGKMAWKSPTVGFGGVFTGVKSKDGRGTFQMTVEMGPDGPRAETLAAPGQSESRESKHFRDQLEMFEKWTYKKFPWKREEMK